MTTKEKRELEILIRKLMQNSIGSDYINGILEHTFKRRTFLDDVIDDVIETSAWKEEGYYSEDDIRLAIGRVMSERLKIEI